MTRPKKEFAKVEAMIYSLAWKMHRLSGIPFEDLRSEAYMAFMGACKSYAKGKSKFSTWCYSKTWFHLRHFLRQRARDRLTFVDEIKDEMLPVETAPLRFSLEEQFNDLSPDARKLIDVIIQRAGAEPQSPRELLREAVEEFRFERGVDEVYADIVVHEIKETLRRR